MKKATTMATSAIAMSPLFLAGALALAVAPGCATSADPEPGDIEVAAQPAQAQEGSAPVAVRIEQAERQLDVGRDAARARSALEAVIADPAASSEERDQATLALSRAQEALGDKEAALATIEKLLAAHEGDESFSLERVAEKRLRKLLTGDEASPRSPHFEDEPIAPIAHALATHFQPRDEGKRSYMPTMVMFNARRGVSERLGTFNVGGALRKKYAAECPLCEDDLNVGRDQYRFGSWTEIPASRKKMETALVVFYFDLGAGRIPARYDELLPMPSAEIVARLERGEGVVVTKRRTGAPPLVLLAAPRTAQLAQVEEAFSGMSELPAEPVKIDVNHKLSPEEIQHVVRVDRSKYIACYETLLARDKKATGRAILKFTVLPAGKVGDATIETEGGLVDATFERCLQEAVETLVFPATPDKTTVAYPFAFSP